MSAAEFSFKVQISLSAQAARTSRRIFIRKLLKSNEITVHTSAHVHVAERPFGNDFARSKPFLSFLRNLFWICFLRATSSKKFCKWRSVSRSGSRLNSSSKRVFVPSRSSEKRTKHFMLTLSSLWYFLSVDIRNEFALGKRKGNKNATVRLIVMQTIHEFYGCLNKGCHIIAPVWNWKISVSCAANCMQKRNEAPTPSAPARKG